MKNACRQRGKIEIWPIHIIDSVGGVEGSLNDMQEDSDKDEVSTAPGS